MRKACRLVLSGRVQGVGFRPFVYRLAHELGLSGSVMNGSGKVFVTAEGTGRALAEFAERLVADAPPLAAPHLDGSEEAEPSGLFGFRILESREGGPADIHVPPDLFMCDDCLAEVGDPAERRHGYPFTNCTQCGPRYTLIARLPYDRPNTAMTGFELCENCRAEYENPLDRRFHAQPLACPACGPHLEFAAGPDRFRGDVKALDAAIAMLKQGDIVAAKGVGGYHLLCDAKNGSAVERLRRRKHRPHKPLAVMFPLGGADGMDRIRDFAQADPAEAAAIAGPERPIVLLRKREQCALAEGIAPDLAEIGAFLPYAPLHHLLLDRFGGPLIATSGNVSGEPVIIDNRMAEARLGNIADAFLHHDRPILRPADDTVLRAIGGRPRTIRAGRGTAPLELRLPCPLAQPLLATGGQMKNAPAIGFAGRAVLLPHVGELDSPRAREVFEHVSCDLQQLYAAPAEAIVIDAHPGYWTGRWAKEQGKPVIVVGHHAAHAGALAGEYPEVETWLTFTWDGVGFGADGTLWGGETLFGRPGAWRRVASLRQFHVTGADRAGREPWRSAAAVMWETGRNFTFADERTTRMAHAAWSKRINTFATSAAGRLFDAAAALVLDLHTATYEGQGPMLLEAVAAPAADSILLPMLRDEDGLLRTDWSPLLDMLADETISRPERAGMFHASLANVICEQVRRLADELNFQAVGLTGGVFQNRMLAEMVMTRLAQMDMPVLMPGSVPANDGGLAFGQIVEAAAIIEGSRE